MSEEVSDKKLEPSTPSRTSERHGAGRLHAGPVSGFSAYSKRVYSVGVCIVSLFEDSTKAVVLQFVLRSHYHAVVEHGLVEHEFPCKDLAAMLCWDVVTTVDRYVLSVGCYILSTDSNLDHNKEGGEVQRTADGMCCIGVRLSRPHVLVCYCTLACSDAAIFDLQCFHFSTHCSCSNLPSRTRGLGLCADYVYVRIPNTNAYNRLESTICRSPRWLNW